MSPHSPTMMARRSLAGLSAFHEWLAFEHGGYAWRKAEQWWLNHGGALPFPRTVTDALDRTGELTMPATISVQPRDKFFDIVERSFPDKLKGAAA